MSGFDGYDQWRTSEPPEYHEDCVEDAEKVLKSYQYAVLNWESSPGNWKQHLEDMKATIERLLDFISDNC